MQSVVCHGVDVQTGRVISVYKKAVVSFRYYIKALAHVFHPGVATSIFFCRLCLCTIRWWRNDNNFCFVDRCVIAIRYFFDESLQVISIRLYKGKIVIILQINKPTTHPVISMR
jgi:hypothetical protein